MTIIQVNVDTDARQNVKMMYSLVQVWCVRVRLGCLHVCVRASALWCVLVAGELCVIVCARAHLCVCVCVCVCVRAHNHT